MEIFFTLQVDCEVTQRTIDNPALGERAARGLAEILSQTGLKATFVVIPPDLKVHAAVYRELEAQGHEVGLHTHPAEQGYNEFLGTYGFDTQQRIISEGVEVFAESLGHRPLAFTPGYCSANDHTYPVLEVLGFRHGTVSLPTRNLPQCACVWGDSPLDAHYPHRYNRSLTGDVDFVDIPPTIDPLSRMWGGAHPQDLRIELVDAKNHWYTLHKNVRRLLAAGETVPIKYLKATTHNIFDYSDPHDFRRETLLGVIAAARQICEQEGSTLVPATSADIAAAYRARVARTANGPTLTLDARGRAAWQTNSQQVSDGH
jgi:peptidoglycan/xylan/chitin deacetylase (PgdA/CDA1 family)